MADRYPKMVVFDADVCVSAQTVGFKEAYPDRFYEMGIAEANMVGAAAGMALCGFTPWVSTFTVFLAKRALDQVRVSVAHANLPVKLNAAYGGLPTGRGEHSFVGRGYGDHAGDAEHDRAVPGRCGRDDRDGRSRHDDRRTSLSAHGALRSAGDLRSSWRPTIGKAARLSEGDDLAICSEGMMTPVALAAVKALAARGIRARLLHYGTIKPFDHEAIIEASRECGAILTIENHSMIGGLGGAVCEALATHAPLLRQADRVPRHLHGIWRRRPDLRELRHGRRRHRPPRRRTPVPQDNAQLISGRPPMRIAVINETSRPTAMPTWSRRSMAVATKSSTAA